MTTALAGIGFLLVAFLGCAAVPASRRRITRKRQSLEIKATGGRLIHVRVTESEYEV